MSASEPEALRGQSAAFTAPVTGPRASAFVPDDSEPLILEDKDAVEIVERMRETHTNRTGQAFLLKLDTLIDRLGIKWDLKRDLVFQHLRTAFERNYPEPNWCVQINQDAWLGLLPGLDAATGARAMAAIWHELCGFFIGEMSSATVPVFEVQVRDVNRLALKKLKVMALQEIDDGAGATVRVRSASPQASTHQAPSPQIPSPQTPSPQIASPLAGQGNPEPVRPESVRPEPLRSVPHAPHPAPSQPPLSQGAAPAAQRPVMVMANLTHAGRNIKIASAIEPLFEMRKMVMIGHRLESIVMDENMVMDRKTLGALDWGLREMIDIVNIDQGLKLLRTRSVEQRKMMMVVPAAFSTFASARARQKITVEVSKAAAEMGLKVLFEVRGLDGVPPHRVLEIVSLIKPFAMTVVGSVSADRRAIGGLAKCGLSGVCIEYDGGKRDEDALKDYLGGMASAAKAAAGACMVQGFDNYRQMAVARLAGVTHASIKTGAMMAPRAAAPAVEDSEPASQVPAGSSGDGAPITRI